MSQSSLPHLRLHNGTIWRWNRPLIGFNRLRQPHIRIEHRVVPAGPTVADSVANAAFFVGLVLCAGKSASGSERLPYPSHARKNFYQAARHGLEADIHWLDGRSGKLRELIRKDAWIGQKQAWIISRDRPGRVEALAGNYC